MATRDRDSRLSQIFEFQKSKGRGTLGALGGAIGGRALEKLDVRNLLFGGPNVRDRTFLQSIGKSIFGSGYAAGPRRGAIGRDSMGGGGIGSDPRVIRVLSGVEGKLDDISRKMTIVAKSSIAQNRVARDVNVIRQNVIKLTKHQTGSATNRADMYFMNAKQREKEYERQFNKDAGGLGRPGAPGSSEEKKSSGTMDFLKKIATIGLGVGAIYSVITGLETIVKSFSEMKNSVENLAKRIKEFDFREWANSISPEKIAEMANNVMNSFMTGITATKEFVQKLIDSIPSEKIGQFITWLTDTFMSTMEFLWKTLKRGLETMSSDQLMKLAAAGGLYLLLFGKGGSAAGGLVGGFLAGILTTVTKALPTLMAGLLTPGGMIALAIGALIASAIKIANDIIEKSDANTEAYQAERERKRLEAEESFVQGMKNLYPNRSEGELRQGVRSLAESELQQANAQLGQISNPRQSTEAKLILQKNLRDKFDPSFGSQNVYAPGRQPIDAEAAKKRRNAERAAKGLPPLPTTSSSAPPSTTPEQIEAPSSPQSNVIRVQNAPAGLPTGFDYDTYTKRIGFNESGNDYGIVNDLGYAGRYQFGAQALETLGYMKPGSSKGGNKAMREPSNWTNGLSLEKFLASPEVQDEAMKKLTVFNYKDLVKKGVITPNMDPNELAGYLAVAHGLGTGGAMEFAQGKNGADAYGTTANKMFTSVSGLTHAGDTATRFKMTPFSSALAGLTEMAEPTMRATGSLLSGLPSNLDSFGNTIVNYFEATRESVENATAAAYDQLASMDIGSLKDIMSPIIARTTLGYF